MNNSGSKENNQKVRMDSVKVDGIRLDEIKLRKTEIIARQILLSFVDVYRWVIPIFDKRRIYRVPFHYYDKFRQDDRDRFYHEMYRLKRAGFIKKYFDGKKEYIELLPKGKNQIKTYITQGLESIIPKTWDRKWRLVIYDISNDKKVEREIFRSKLESFGFIKLQESVYVYPFECGREISLLKNMYSLGLHVQYIIADHIETEIDLIKKFYDRDILDQKMLDTKTK